MKRTIAVVFALATTFASGTVAVAGATTAYHESLCQARPFACLDAYKSIGANGEYVGHDEPTVEFLSNRPGTGGGDLTYTMILPKNPPTRPNQAGTGGTWDFQLRATFWFGLTLCDSESWPNFTKTCTPNSDSNALFRSSNPHSRHFI